MKLKIVPLLCAAVLLTTTTVHANTTITETDLVANSKDVDVKVTAEISSTFTVSLPATIELTENKTNYTYSGSVGVKGDIDSGHNVLVVPANSITMHDVTARPEGVLEYEGYTHKDPVQGTVSQLETAWDYIILSSGTTSGNFTYDGTQYYNTSLTITTPKLSAGDWEGTLTYDISLASNLPHAQQTGAGLYDADDNLLVAWGDSGIDVSTNYTSDNYNTSTTSGYYVITNNYPTTKKVIMPDSVTSIGNYAFYKCSGLTSVVIPDSVTIIDEYAFGMCESLNSVTIPDSITSIGIKAFYGCSGLTSVTIPDSVTSIGKCAFHYCTGLTSVTIPNSVTSIERSTFDNCTSLTSVTIPDSVTSIGDNAFCWCTSLTSVTIPNSVTHIRSYAFSYCTGLTSVTIPDSVTNIGERAFCGCTGLTSVTIPDSVKVITSDAFLDVPHIYYNGSAYGSPWGAKAIN